MKSRPELFGSHRTKAVCVLLCALGLGLGSAGMAWADAAKAESAPPTGSGEVAATSASSARDVGNQVRAALGLPPADPKKFTLVIKSKTPAASNPQSTMGSAKTHTAKAIKPGKTSQAALKARSTAEAGADEHAHETHWDYGGENGPQNWGKLKSNFNLCATGKRQSPINIDEKATLQGPAEPLEFNYTPSKATVVNNGHTIQVDVVGDNYITVRNTNYRLVQFHFHSPSEEQINGKRFPMVAHLVHKSDAGQLAVVAVLLDMGEPHVLLDKVWTYMPLDKGDRVAMPAGVLNLNEMLPADQRYYQYMGSLTTPPCSEGVLWMVLKQAVQMSPLQLRVFTQLYPNNARPIQSANGRPVRDAQ